MTKNCSAMHLKIKIIQIRQFSSQNHPNRVTLNHILHLVQVSTSLDLNKVSKQSVAVYWDPLSAAVWAKVCERLAESMRVEPSREWIHGTHQTGKPEDHLPNGRRYDVSSQECEAFFWGSTQDKPWYGCRMIWICHDMKEYLKNNSLWKHLILTPKHHNHHTLFLLKQKKRLKQRKRPRNLKPSTCLVPFNQVPAFKASFLHWKMTSNGEVKQSDWKARWDVVIFSSSRKQRKKHIWHNLDASNRLKINSKKHILRENLPMTQLGGPIVRCWLGVSHCCWSLSKDKRIPPPLLCP